MRADDDGRIPVPAQRHSAPGFGRPDSHALSGALIESYQLAILQLCIYGIRVFGIDNRFEPVAALGDKPISVGNARSARSPRRASQAEVILRTSIDIVEGPCVIDGNIIELSDGQVRLERPCLGPIKAFVDS